MKRTKLTWYLPVLILTASMSSCKDKDKVKDPQPSNENEVFTTLIIKLVDSSDVSKTYELKYKDLNQDDQVPAQVIIPDLEDNKTYFGEVLVLDESKAVTDTISIEVAEESDEHQFVFTTNKAGLSVSYAADDIDEKGYPVGLYPTIRTKALKGQQANLQVVLYHLPGVKKASPVENAKNGSPDLDVIFADIHIK